MSPEELVKLLESQHINIDPTKLKSILDVTDRIDTEKLANLNPLGLDVVSDTISNYKCPICGEKYPKKDSIIKEIKGERQLFKTTGKQFINGLFGSSGTEITKHYVQDIYRVRFCKECASKALSFMDLKKAEEYNALVDPITGA